jgi:serine/threonine protein kinase
MTPERFDEIERVCQLALDRPAAERDAFLNEACRDDPDLRREVGALLAGASRAAALLETPPSVPVMPALGAGQRLGPYEIESAIGAGGMGEVYKARDTRLDRTVAIKVLPAGCGADPARRARFEREAKAIAGLNHPHICALHDVGAHGGSLFLVMEHLTGETLAERLARGRLPLNDALSIGAEIADALAAAHRQGVIHRDVKPANVMLTKSGAKLLDFGLAKLRGHGEQAVASQIGSAAAATLTSEGTIVGTLQYMAPEQLEGKPSDARTDIRALGAVLYEMVTGTRAFDGESRASVVAAIMSEPPSVLTRRPKTPPALDRVIARCLARDPDQRWDSAHDVADELRWIRDTVAAPAREGSRRRRRWAAIAAGGTITIAAVLAWLFTGGPPQQPTATSLTSYSGVEAHPRSRPTAPGSPSSGAAIWKTTATSTSIRSARPARRCG